MISREESTAWASLILFLIEIPELIRYFQLSHPHLCPLGMRMQKEECHLLPLLLYLSRKDQENVHHQRKRIVSEHHFYYQSMFEHKYLNLSILQSLFCRLTIGTANQPNQKPRCAPIIGLNVVEGARDCPYVIMKKMEMLR